MTKKWIGEPCVLGFLDKRNRIHDRRGCFGFQTAPTNKTNQNCVRGNKIAGQIAGIPVE